MFTEHEHDTQTEPDNDLTWTQEIEVAGEKLVDHVKELIEEGNVRRLILRYPDNRILMELPLTAGVAVGGAVALFAPQLAAIAAVAALVTHIKLEVVRTEDTEHFGTD